MVHWMHAMIIVMFLCDVGVTLCSINTCQTESAGDDEDEVSMNTFFQQRAKGGSKMDLVREDGRFNTKSLMTAAMKLRTSRMTPEVNTTLHELIAIIETDIEANIMADKNATQQALDSALQAFGNASNPIPDWKQGADSAEQEYNTCMVAKNNLDTAHSECIIAQQNVNTTKGTTCAEKEAKQSKTYTFPSNLSCEFSTGQCGTQIDTIRAFFETWLTSVQTLSTQHHTEYTSAKAECGEATSNLTQKTVECQEKKTTYDNKVLECEHLDARRKIKICSFGDKLQMKCDKKEQYTQLVAKVNDVNTSHQHSQRDREMEWRSIQVIKCVLQRQAEGHEINSTTMSNCTKTDAEATADFEEKIGLIDLKESEYLSQLGESFKCDVSMNSITFGTHNTQTFDSTLSNPPFSFCALTTNTCGENFNCVVGGVERTKKPATTTCQLESGCTTADCCEDIPTPAPTPAPTPLATNWTHVVELELGTSGWQAPIKLNGMVYVISNTTIHKIDDQGIASQVPVTGTFPAPGQWRGLDQEYYCDTDTNEERMFCILWQTDKGMFLDGVSDTAQVVQLPHSWFWNTFYVNGKFYVMAERRGGNVHASFDPADTSLSVLQVPQEVFNGEPGYGGYVRLYGAENGFIVALPNNHGIFYAIALEVATETFHYADCCSNRTLCRQVLVNMPYGWGKALSGNGKLYAMPVQGVAFGLVFDTTTKQCSSVPLTWPKYNPDPNNWNIQVFSFMYYNPNWIKVNGKYYLIPMGNGVLENMKVQVFDPAVGFSSLREIGNKTIQDLSPNAIGRCTEARAQIQGSKVFVRCNKYAPHIWSIDTETESTDSVCQVTNKAIYGLPKRHYAEWATLGDHLIFPPVHAGEAIEVWDDTAKELSEVPFPEGEPSYYRSIVAHNKLYIGAYDGSELAIYG